MRRTLRSLVVLSLLLFPVANFAWDVIAHEYVYYEDATFSQPVGEWSTTCDGQIITWGDTGTSYRTFTRVHCNWNIDRTVCQQFVDGSWTTIPCP